ADATTGGRRAARTRQSSTTHCRPPGRRSSASSAEPGVPPMRTLALDYGGARIGCAVSDPSGTVVRPLAVIEPPDAGAVARLVSENDVELVVVGLPMNMNG